MKQTVKLLKAGFESSSGKTPEFLNFVKVFKSEFKKELESIGATNIVFSVGHFHISGFFTADDGQIYYFSLPDVRSFSYGFAINPDATMNKLMYRTAKDYKDYTGGKNRYVKIESGMADNMCWYFKVID
jgi:hypothetical protein